ncbi:hypothetical protein LCGC14_2139800 [marine sediment metagenome]|uniref:Uncharacterized protein n=1 Tax=marine sediment metagenome TaxID=412755 RepID=A0A0F9DZ01_9ZZZZ
MKKLTYKQKVKLWRRNTITSLQGLYEFCFKGTHLEKELNMRRIRTKINSGKYDPTEEALEGYIHVPSG